MALPPMGPMSPPSPFLGGPQANMGPPPFPPMPQMGGGMGMALRWEFLRWVPRWVPHQ